MANWDQEDGFVILKRIVGFETALLAQKGCGLRISFVHDPADVGIKHDAIQFAMTPKQARQLAQDLNEIAAKVQMLLLA